MSSWKTLVGIFRIPIWLRDSLPYWQHLSKKPKKLSSLSYFIQYNTHAPWRSTPTIETNGYHHCNFIQYQSYAWQRSDPFFWKNSFFDCNCGNDLVVALEYAFIQLCSKAKGTSIKLKRFRRSHVKRLLLILISCTCYTSFFA